MPTSPIVAIFTAITRPIKDALVFLVAVLYNHALKPCANAFVYVTRELFWKVFVVNLLWQSILVPLGIIGAQLAYLLFKSLYYGPFLDRQVLFDGLLGAPRESVVLGHPFQVWIPTRSLFLVFGTLFGLGLGLRNYIDLVGTALRCAWYGPWPDHVHLDDGLFKKPRASRQWRASHTGGDAFAYHHAWSAPLALVVGAGVGVRAVLNILLVFPRFAWFGPFPRLIEDVAKFAQVSLPCAKASDWDTPWASRPLALMFGCGLGFRFYVGTVLIVLDRVLVGGSQLFGFFLLGALVGLSPRIHCEDGLVPSPLGGNSGYYSSVPFPYHNAENDRPLVRLTTARRIAMTLGAVTLGVLGLGLINIFNLFTVMVVAGYYGAWSPHVKFRKVDFGDPNRKMQTPAGILFGCVFGLVLGWRCWVELVCILVFAVLLAAWYLVRGAWFGVVPTVHSAHGLVPGDPDAYKDNPGQSVFGRIGAVVLGLVLGWRWILDSLSALVRCSWYGAFPTLQLPRERTILGPVTGFQEQDVWRVLKSLPGLLVGWRIVVDVLLFCGITTYSTIVLGLHLSGRGLVWVIKNAELCADYLTTGAWEGAKPGLFHCRDGLFDPPSQLVMMSKWQEILIGAGSIISLGIGFRNILNGITVLFPAIWHGSLPGHMCFPDGFLAEDMRLYALHSQPRHVLTSNDTLVPSPITVSPSSPHANGGLTTTPPGSPPPSPTKRHSLSVPSSPAVMIDMTSVTPGPSPTPTTPLLPTTTVNPRPSPTRSSSPTRYPPVPPPGTVPEMTTLFGKLLGTTVGLTFGLKRALDMLYVVFARGVWNGAHSQVFDIADAPLRNALADAYTYQHWTGHVLGGIGGCVVGVRFVLLCMLTALKGVWLGSAPAWTHAQEGWLSVPPEWGNKYVGWVFGLFGAGYGVRAIINTLTLIPGAMWYGCVGPEFLVEIHRVGTAKRFAVSKTAKLIGSVVGFGIGLRTVANVLYLVVVGMWWGAAPETLTLHDAPSSIRAKKFPERREETWFGAVFGLGVGLYPIVVAILYIPVASWYGCYPEMFKLPESISLWSHDVGSSAPSRPLTRFLGAIFGLIFGTRILFDLILMGIIAAFSGFAGYVRRKPSGRTSTNPNETRSLLTRAFHTTLGALVLGGIGFGIPYAGYASALPEVRLRNSIIGAVIGAVLATAGIFNLCNVAFYAAAIELARDVVLVLIGASLYLPLFAVLLLVTHQARSVYKIARYVAGVGKPQPERYRVAAAHGTVSVVGAWGLAAATLVVLRILVPLASVWITYGVPVGVLLAVNLAAVVVQRLFSKELFTIRGWPIESSTALTSQEVHKVNEYMYAAIRMAKLGLRSDPVQGLRFYIRDLGLISPDERKLKVMYELFLDNALEVRNGSALRYTDLLMHTDQQPLPAADGDGENAAGAPTDASAAALPTQAGQGQSRLQAMLSSSSIIPMPTPPTQDSKSKSALQPSALRGSIEPTSSSQANVSRGDEKHPSPDSNLPPLPPSPSASSSAPAAPPSPTTSIQPLPNLMNASEASSSSSPPPPPNQDAAILATEPASRPAPPSFAEAIRAPALFARSGAAAGAPEYDDLGPTAIQDLDEATGAGQFALRELVTGPPGEAVLELRFAENVDMKMLAKGFKPKLLVIVRRTVVGRPSDAGRGDGRAPGAGNERTDRKGELPEVAIQADRGQSNGGS